MQISRLTAGDDLDDGLDDLVFAVLIAKSTFDALLLESHSRVLAQRGPAVRVDIFLREGTPTRTSMDSEVETKFRDGRGGAVCLESGHPSEWLHGVCIHYEQQRSIKIRHTVQ